jgi:amidophosphoribosyltransferase
VAHNGNLVNASNLKNALEEEGSIFHSSSDSEVMIHLIARSKVESMTGRVLEMLGKIKGAYSCLFLSEKELIGIRDPNGFRPLVLGALGESYVLASETCALDLIGADFVREIEPGEMIQITKAGINSFRPFVSVTNSQCIFEYIYFARPDSLIFGRQVYEVRKELGRQLAREQPVRDADMIIPVPDSGVGAAIGYAYELGIPFDMGMIRNHYVGRTFIEPEQRIRHFGVKLKLNIAPSTIEGKKVVIIDDSIVRGTTSRKIIEMVRSRGAKEVHLRISSPPTRFPCYYGIDTPDREELIASQNSVDEIKKFITSDSIGYLSVQGMHNVVNSIKGERGFCDACFTGNYPVIVENRPFSKNQMHLFENGFQCQ